MSNNQQTRYQFDPSGTSRNNRVREEKIRAIDGTVVFKCGLMYAETVEITTGPGAEPLKEKRDFEFVGFDLALSTELNKPVVAGIAFKNAACLPVGVSGQYVGGEQGIPTTLLCELQTAIEKANTKQTIDSSKEEGSEKQLLELVDLEDTLLDSFIGRLTEVLKASKDMAPHPDSLQALKDELASAGNLLIELGNRIGATTTLAAAAVTEAQLKDSLKDIICRLPNLRIKQGESSSVKLSLRHNSGIKLSAISYTDVDIALAEYLITVDGSGEPSLTMTSKTAKNPLTYNVVTRRVTGGIELVLEGVYDSVLKLSYTEF